MSEQHYIPVLPDSAPFSPEQRAYLNGFFAGLFSRQPIAGAAAVPPAALHPLQPISILFGSQTGNAEKLAKQIAKQAGQRGFAPTIHEMARYPTAQLAAERHVLIVTSTYGDGEPPDNAKSFWEYLSSDAAPTLTQFRFSVCALGDSNYPQFCAFGKHVDERLKKLGGVRVHARVDCDVDFETPFARWLSGALGAVSDIERPLSPSLSPSEGERENRAQSLGESGADGDSSASTRVRNGSGNHSNRAAISEGQSSLFPLSRGGGEGRGEGAARTVYSRSNPLSARLITNRKLNAPGSAKDVRHFEISIANSGLSYEVGDALGVIPQNDPTLVNELLAALGASGAEAVPIQTGGRVALREALTRHYEITRISKPLLEMFAARTGDELLAKVSAPNANGELTRFLWGRQIIDLVLAHPSVRLLPAEFVVLLRKLQPRLYSISSSPKAHPDEVHLTVSALRYESLGRARAGVCSTFLADRVAAETPAPVFVHSNKNFRPPASSDTPMIMAGPGTGIAPFRAFLEERRATGATGKSWLFFGDQKSATDFLYREEIEAFHKDGLLMRFDLAWSRDQAKKIYVQNRMLESERGIYAWLEAGAHFYVCGDASRMAKDVDAALHQVVQSAGGKSPGQAVEYVKALSASRRYQRDVY